MVVLDHCARHERPPFYLRHLPGDYSLATHAGCGRLFSSSRPMDARPVKAKLGERLIRCAMDLRLYDTLSREKRVFSPLDPANVRMYVCGPTVYDYAHIGNARPVIVFDVLFRLLRHLYGAEHVTYVRNITDVDDKINARAAEEYPGAAAQRGDPSGHGKDRQAIPRGRRRARLPAADGRAARDRAHRRDARPDRAAGQVRPRLCRRRQCPVQRALDAGLRPALEAAARRDDRRRPRRSRALQERPADFVLWKPSKPGEPAWPSPAGINAPGRPGWHIECSAMSWKYLGETFDIHGGGIDLVFPHHEDEIAQSRCAFHTPVMANYWMHNGFLQVEGEKMWKSAGEFRDHQRVAAGLAGRGRALPHVADALSPADQLDRRRSARSTENARSLVRADRRVRAGLSVRRWARCARGRPQYAESLCPRCTS